MPPFASGPVDAAVLLAVWLLVLGAGLAVVATSWRLATVRPAPVPRPPIPGPDSADGGSNEDPLDAAAAFPNQFTGNNKDGQCRREKAEIWSALPVYSKKPELRLVVRSMLSNNVTMLVSGTGSGKTVIVPKLAHRLLVENGPPLSLAEKARLWLQAKRPPGATVAVTNPKIITTAENASFSAALACVALGDQIGYRYRDSPRDAASLETRLEYVTDGYLLSVAKTDPDFSEYGCIIVDEAHERPVPTDFLLLALKRAMLRRPELRVVVMSATIDTGPFVRWFEEDGLRVGDVTVSGQPNFPVTEIYRPVRKGNNYLSEAVRTVLDIDRSPNAVPGAILVFVPLTADTASGCLQLADACREAGLRCSLDPASDDTPNLRCLRLYSGVDDETKDVAISPSGSSLTRNVVFSTNVAESSLTVEDLSYVIDSGQVFRVSYDAAADATVSGRKYVTKAEATQRRGRVGRKRPGVAVLLYPKTLYDNVFEDQPKPSILDRDLTAQLFDEMVSSEASWGDTVAEVGRLLTPPTPAQISIATATLRFYGLIDSDGYLSEPGIAFSELYKLAKAEFSDCLLLAASKITGAERAAARYIACTEGGAIAWLSAALRERGKMPPECGASDHSTAVRVFEAAANHLGQETAALRARAEQLEEAALANSSNAQLAKAWPWSWLQQQQGIAGIFLCAFANNATRCPSSGSALSLQRCDEFFRAVAAANLMRANRGGSRLFGGGAGSPPALNSMTTEALQNAVHVGSGYNATRQGHVLRQSTALAPESVASLLSSR
jgi:HrpA-like RNA helicase